MTNVLVSKAKSVKLSGFTALNFSITTLSVSMNQFY